MSTYADRLKALREQLKASQLGGFVVPLTDEHMSEYVGSYAQRLAWLTGFEGSAGSAVVLPEEAAIFVDGRYTLQVRQQVSATEWSYQSVPETSTTEWLKDHAPGRRAHRLRSLAAHPGLGEEGEGSARQPWCRARARGPQSDRRGVERPSRGVEGQARRPARPICGQVRFREAHRDRRLAAEAACRCGGPFRARIRSPGRSTSAGRTSATRRSLLLTPWSTPTAPPICSSRPRRSARTCSSISATESGSTSAPNSRAR